MNGYIVGQLLETITLIVLGFCFLVIIISSFYDVWMIRQQKIIQLQTMRLRRYRPHVTVLIYAKNSTHVISKCLESIIKNRYRQYDIVVVNGSSVDDTKQQLSRFQHMHPTARLRVYNQRKETTIHTALQLGYKKSQRGEIILTLRPDTVIPKTFLKESVAHFMAIHTLRNDAVVLCNEQLQPLQSLAGVLQQFLQASRRLMYKTVSFLGFDWLISIDEHMSHTAIYEKGVFMKKTIKKRHYIYDSTLLLQILALPLSMFSKKRTKNELVVLYVLGVISTTYVTYSLYMAATLQNTALLLVGWVLIVVWFFAAVWSDETAKISEKLRLSFVLPSLYFFLYLVVTAEVIIRFIIQLYKSIRIVIQGIILFYASPLVPFEK